MSSTSKYQEAKKEKLAVATKKAFLEIYNPKQLAKDFAQVKHPLQCIDSGGDNLFALRRNFGNNKVLALIKLYLIELNEMLNLKRSLTEAMIDAIADELIASFSMLNMADVHLVFRRAKTGYYGELYESLNMPKVMSWFADYFEERCSAAAERSVNEAQQYKADTPRVSDAMAEEEKAFKIGYMKFVNNR